MDCILKIKAEEHEFVPIPANRAEWRYNSAHL
jgi:hypothetical protein